MTDPLLGPGRRAYTAARMERFGPPLWWTGDWPPRPDPSDAKIQRALKESLNDAHDNEEVAHDRA